MASGPAKPSAPSIPGPPQSHPASTPPPERRAFLAIGHGSRRWVEDLPAGRRFLVGADPGSDLPVPELPGSASLVFDGEHVVLEPSGAVFVNGKRHEGVAALRLGDEITAGAVQVVVGISMGPDATSRRVVTHEEFRERVWEEVARAARSQRPTSLAMVQTRPGAGRSLAARALATFRAGDVVGTYAGDEVELLLPDTPKEAARLVVDRLVERTEAGPVVVGVALFPDDGDGPERLLRAAREALARAAGDGETGSGDPGGPVLPEVSSPVTRELVAHLEKVARVPGPVLLTGEASVGKSVFARLLHEHDRPEGPFRRVLCSTWGRRRGHGGGADRLLSDARALDAVRGGTLVLDEVTELEPPAQRALEAALAASPEGAVRVVATAHRDLGALVTRGAFDPDLAERLGSGSVVRIPALRERPEDILPLAERFAREAAGPESPVSLSLGAIARLRSYPWFGNVLELRNAMERAVRVAHGGEILAEHLPSEVLPASSSEGKLREHVDGVERDAIVRALADANHNQTHAARRLGLSRRALIYKMEKYGLKAPPGSGRRT